MNRTLFNTLVMMAFGEIKGIVVGPIFKTLSQNLFGGIEKNHEDLKTVCVRTKMKIGHFQSTSYNLSHVAGCRNQTFSWGERERERARESTNSPSQVCRCPSRESNRIPLQKK